LFVVLGKSINPHENAITSISSSKKYFDMIDCAEKREDEGGAEWATVTVIEMKMSKSKWKIYLTFFTKRKIFKDTFFRNIKQPKS
jgi:hypothetical protein